MVPAPSPLPTRFPCWCRAVYSWGGESKRDLGFIEGDLIECLNAGDGSWWVGKLYRDRRTVGSFPSNFVQVLPESFRPTTRTVSPLPDASASSSSKAAPHKSKTFRKPFEAYVKAPHYTTAKQPETFKEDVVKPPQQSRSRENSGASLAKKASISAATAGGHHGSWSSRAPSPAPSQYRARSPAPPHMRSHSPAPPPMRSHSPAPPPMRAHSPAPPMRGHSPAPPQHHRGPSPAPYQEFRSHSPAPFAPRATSPVPAHDYRLHSPAPPPPHHHHHQRGPSPVPPGAYRAYSPAPQEYQPYHPRSHSPAPPLRDPFSAQGPSPAPAFHRDVSPGADDLGSPPPPPPPPHRHMTHRPGSARPGSARPGSARPASAHPESVRPGSAHPTSMHMRDRYSFDATAQHPNGSYKPFTPSDPDLMESCKPAALSRNGSKASQLSVDTSTPRANRDHSPGGHQLTPSPLREAMDGVMEQLDELQGYGGSQETSQDDEPGDPWSPACFDLVSKKSRRQAKDTTRPLTSMGIAQTDEGYETWSGGSSNNPSFHDGGRERSNTSTELPQLSSYVARMEKQFQSLHKHSQSTPSISRQEEDDVMPPPPPPPKGQPFKRPKSSMSDRPQSEHKLSTRKSAYDVDGGVTRTLTTKTNSTNASTGNQSNTSSSTQSSSRTLWSGASASGFSNTSAGSMARANQRAQSALGMRDVEPERPETPFTGVTYHSSHASGPPALSRSQTDFHESAEAGGGLGGLVSPKAPRRNIFRKIFDTAKTGVASSRGSIAAGSIGPNQSMRSSPLTKTISQASSSTPAIAALGGSFGRSAAREMGVESGVDWVQVRRDVNRSNSLSSTEKTERRDRCQMMDQPTLNPVDELYESVEGDEAADGSVVQQSVDYRSINLGQVDKNSRFISNLPLMTTAITLATTYVCRPYRNDVQRLRAIFAWVAENITWEEDFEGDADTRQVIQDKRACAKEYACLVSEMCQAVGLPSEVVRGYLKVPGEVTDLATVPRANHWWNAVIVDNEWRIIDCCLASPSNPHRGQYANAAGSAADPWWFLMRPLEACWTHIPEHHDQQHIVPPVAHEVLLNLPCACAPFFRNDMEMYDYNTSLTRIEDLEMVHVKLNVPADVEIAAEVEARAYAKDADGDRFESGDVVKKRALAQAEWYNGTKRYTIKALLPGDEGQGVLKIYAGKRGLMQSIKDIPHPMALSLPIVHGGENPRYEFVMRHPTPHAQRHDIYVVQPQCQRLALNNTFVFAIRQHPSSSGPANPLTPASNPGGSSPVPFTRPGSAMSMTASIAGSSNPSMASGTVAGKKPAKLAIQTPGGKILRLMRKEDRNGRGGGGSSKTGGDEEASDGGTWETIIKCSERGVWRGLVLADRTARWCVFAEWVCVG